MSGRLPAIGRQRRHPRPGTDRVVNEDGQPSVLLCQFGEQLPECFCGQSGSRTRAVMSSRVTSPPVVATRPNRQGPSSMGCRCRTAVPTSRSPSPTEPQARARQLSATDAPGGSAASADRSAGTPDSSQTARASTRQGTRTTDSQLHVRPGGCFDSNARYAAKFLFRSRTIRFTLGGVCCAAARWAGV